MILPLKQYIWIVKKSNRTYHIFTKATATLLLMAFLIPSGLQAKALVDFCKMEMSKQAQSEMCHIPDEKADAHSCCESDTDQEKEADHTHHDCEWGFICACNIGESQLGDLDWVINTQEWEIQLTERKNLSPFVSSDENIHSNQQIHLTKHDPPLWLVYDTLLM